MVKSMILVIWFPVKDLLSNEIFEDWSSIIDPR
jgi:hypothetical protein